MQITLTFRFAIARISRGGPWTSTIRMPSAARAMQRKRSTPGWSDLWKLVLTKSATYRRGLLNANVCVSILNSWIVLYPPIGLVAAGSNADTIVHGLANALFASEISLCGLNRNVTEQELDLLQLTSGKTA
jgi:hypothetical protein